MHSGWRYRIQSVVGVMVLTAIAVMIVNSPPAHAVFQRLPVVGQLASEAPMGAEIVFEAMVATAVVTAAFIPLYKPRPRRILDTVIIVQKRVVTAMLALATIGYFDYTYRLPRATLIAITTVSLVVLPAWFTWIRRRPTGPGERTIIVGDGSAAIRQLVGDIDTPLLGYLCPTSSVNQSAGEPLGTAVADGGTKFSEIDNLGGLSRLEEVLVEYDVDTVVLAFEQTDRGEFFGALSACHEHGIKTTVHRDHADQLLTSGENAGTLVNVDIEPWDIQDHLVKRGFDIAFAVVGLVVLSPVILAIAVAIKASDGGSILYGQERTAVFGDRFDIYKFRSMVENAEAETGVTLSEEDTGDVDPRVTRVGQVLRQTHFDEIPQLWAVLRGDMSVVGPRPERPELDSDIQSGVTDWHKRWFVKPGLTGLAQVHDVTGADPEQKLRHDLQYVKQQSFWYDLKLVVRQIWTVMTDAVGVIR